MRRIRADHEAYEMRKAVVREARKPYLCDHFKCESFPKMWDRATWKIQRGDQYAYLSHGLKICARHYLPTDVEEVTP